MLCRVRLLEGFAGNLGFAIVGLGMGGGVLICGVLIAVVGCCGWVGVLVLGLLLLWPLLFVSCRKAGGKI